MLLGSLRSFHRGNGKVSVASIFIVSLCLARQYCRKVLELKRKRQKKKGKSKLLSFSGRYRKIAQLLTN